MKIVVEHKINRKQKEELKEEFNEAIDELQKQLAETFAGWERTKTVVTYTIVGVAVGSFGLGYFIGRSRGD